MRTWTEVWFLTPQAESRCKITYLLRSEAAVGVGAAASTVAMTEQCRIVKSLADVSRVSASTLFLSLCTFSRPCPCTYLARVFCRRSGIYFVGMCGVDSFVLQCLTRHAQGPVETPAGSSFW
jgi:hypothetical protein